MSRADFTDAVRRYHGGLWLIAFGRLGERAAAEDVLQEAYLVAWRKRDEFRPGTNMRAWLAKIVRFAASDAAKSRDRRRERGDGAIAAAVSPSLDCAARDRTALSDDQTHFDDVTTAALSELTSEARTCLLLRVVENYSYAEISQAVGVAEGTAMSHVHRAKAKLRRRLADSRTERATE